MTGQSPPITISDSAAHWLAQALSDRQLYAILQGIPIGEEIFRGQKMTVPSAGRKIVRSRVKTELRRLPEFLALLLSAPDTPWAPWNSAMEMLDECWLARHWRQLVRSRGGRNMIVAMALDERRPIRERGERLLRRTLPWTTDTDTWNTPETHPPNAWKALLGILATEQPPEPTTKRATVKEPVNEKLERRTTALQKEIDKLQAARGRQKEKADALQQKLDAVTDENAAEKRELRRQLRDLSEENTRLHTDMRERVDERVNAFRRSALGMTSQVEEARRELQKQNKDSLIERAQKILDAHQKLNEKYGTIRDIETELDALQATLDDITQCLTQSVTVLPEIHQVSADIVHRIDTLRQRLPTSRTSGTSQLLHRFQQTIAQASLENKGISMLAAMQKNLNTPPLDRLLTDRERKHIEEALQAKLETLQTVQKERTLAAVTPAREQPEAKYPLDIWDVNNALQQLPASSRPTLFIDGYNVIKRLPELNALSEHASLAQAREKLCEMCQTHKNDFEHIEIVFDGKGALSNREAFGGLSVVFSAELETSQNADNYIVQRIQKTHAETDVVWLVTADRGLLARVASRIQGVVAPADFYNYLGND